MHQLVIIGSGPAGYTAAIYAARAGLRPILLASSVEAGGELMKTTDVENFPGFPEGIEGPALMERMQEQAERFGTEVLYEDVAALELAGDTKTVTLGSGETLEARAVIYATGSQNRRLGLADEDRLAGAGVSWCATCDGFFFAGQDLAVVGGGDSAMEEAIFLTRFAAKVYVVYRGSELRASKIMVDRALANPKIEFVFNTTITGIDGLNKVKSVSLLNGADGVTSTLPVGGVFIAIGNDPRTHLVHGQLDLTEAGTIAVAGRSSKTNLSGVFAAGDVVDPAYRQAITAAASGAVAGLDAEHYLSALA